MSKYPGDGEGGGLCLMSWAICVVGCKGALPGVPGRSVMG